MKHLVASVGIIVWLRMKVIVKRNLRVKLFGLQQGKIWSHPIPLSSPSSRHSQVMGRRLEHFTRKLPEIVPKNINNCRKTKTNSLDFFLPAKKVLLSCFAVWLSYWAILVSAGDTLFYVSDLHHPMQLQYPFDQERKGNFSPTLPVLLFWGFIL